MINYILAVTQIPFLRYAWNTIVITALCVVGTVISSAMVAYSMSKVRWNGKKYLFPIIVATMMIDLVCCCGCCDRSRF